MAWIAKNAYLTQTEMENNATEFAGITLSYGWSRNAIAAILGNLESESGINPGIWENLEPYAGGYGLVQWTPYTKYSEWYGEGWQNNGNAQCARIKYEVENGLQWISTSEYPMSFKEFITSDRDVGYLAWVWLYNYERPADLNQPQRAEQAEYWAEFIGGVHAKVPVWLLFKLSERSGRKW